MNNRKGEFKKELKDFVKKGFGRFIIDGVFYESNNLPELNKNNKHSIKVIVDRLQADNSYKNRIAESVETALNLSDGVIYFHDVEKKKIISFRQNFLVLFQVLQLKKLNLDYFHSTVLMVRVVDAMVLDI